MTSNDRNRLRELAQQQMEIAHSPRMQELERLWYLHNDLKGERPMVTVETNFQDDVYDLLMQCEDPDARAVEQEFLLRLVNATHYMDDHFVPAYFPVKYQHKLLPFDIPVQKEHAEGIGHHFIPVIQDLESDFEKLKPSTFTYDTLSAANERVAYYQEIFGDILPVKLEGHCMVSCLTQSIVHLMEMEDIYISMIDEPELFYQMMENLANDYITFFETQQANQMILPTTRSEHLGQGTYCFTHDLPDVPNPSLSQVWGFMDSQETVGVSPEMFAEFIFPHYKKIADRMGLVSYGCCEPVHPIWENCLSKMNNLRKVSISPWCDVSKMGEYLKTSNVIFQRKPSPNFLGVNPIFDEDAARAHIRETVEAAKGCHLEFTQRDVLTVHHDLDKVKRYVEIIREEYSSVSYR